MLSVEEAQAKVLASVDPLRPVDVEVAAAEGLVCSADLYAPVSLPLFANSAMDGYAVRSSDVALAAPGSPVELTVTGEVRAGDPGEIDVSEGTAVRIMTGAKIPVGADAVIPVEETEGSDAMVSVKATAAPGRNIRPAGEDVLERELLMRAGTELGPGELALIASLGMSPLQVHPSPRVAVIVTGAELVPPEREPPPGGIRDSNTVALTTLVRQAGGRVVSSVRVTDDREATRAAFAEATEGSDLIVSSGGVAVGRYDFVKEVVEDLGSLDMWKVAMQPGKPVVLGSVAGTPMLGLPGNPVSVHVSFEQFVRPALRKLRGCTTFFRPRIRALLTHPLEKSPGRQHFVRVRLARSGEGWYATPTGPQGSHIQSSLVLCHGLAIFEAEASRLVVGQEVAVEVWRLPVATGPTGPSEPEAEVT